MKIGDLRAPITASKSDWLSGDGWLGFSPRANTADARAQCQSTINRQFGNGYVLEYITETFGKPAPGFESHPKYLADKRAHAEIAGRLIAVHRLRPTARPLEQILSPAEFASLQDMWDHSGTRTRWSVAFPIIESYAIDGRPRAKEVFTYEAYSRIYKHSSSTLRPLEPHEHEQLVELTIIPQQAANAWIAIEDQFAMAELSDIDRNDLLKMERDLPDRALEGMTAEMRAKVRRRAAWLAGRFARRRTRQGELWCDSCGFDPASRTEAEGLRLRSLLDVHHKHPLAEGVRYTTEDDFSLLCPVCHRLEHMLLKVGRSLFPPEHPWPTNSSAP